MTTHLKTNNLSFWTHRAEKTLDKWWHPHPTTKANTLGNFMWWVLLKIRSGQPSHWSQDCDRPGWPSRAEPCTLYPWLMPLMNCWGGGFQRNWMVVEFTASVCTFCGGAVGTVPRQSWKTAKQTVGGPVGRREEKETLSCHSWFTGHYSIENREVW